MDPDALLEQMRDAARRTFGMQETSENEDLATLVNGFVALDEWITKGGFLPSPWRKKVSN